MNRTTTTSGDRGRSRQRAVAAIAGLLALLCTSCLLRPIEGEGPLRFRDEVFSTVVKTADVQYGQAVRQDGTTMDLRFDLYEPQADAAPLRPLLIWVHGGSFSAGNKTSGELVDMAHHFGRRGYVSASISYRLSATGCTRIDAVCIESIVDATEDSQAAVRYFRANAADYRIDPNRIAIAGSSAGGIAAMNTGFKADVPGNSGTPGVSSDVGAVMSLSGARLLGSCTEPGAKVLMFHNEVDPLVPYLWAQNTIDCANTAPVWSHLETWPGSGHVPYVQNRTQILDTSTVFFFNALNLRPLAEA